MILPLFGFLIFGILSTFFAIISLLLIPKLKLNIINILAFDFSAGISLLLISIFYNLIFNISGHLDETWKVILYFIVALSSLIIGGLFGLILLNKIKNHLKTTSLK